MPLKPGKENIGKNIDEMEKSGHSHNQSVAAALNEAGIGKAKSPKKKTHDESFDSLINKYLTNFIFSEDVINSVTPANPNAPADPKQQAKIKLARQKKVQSLQKNQTKPATQAEADAYELGRTEKI
jgi:hypothetical protein